MSDERTVTAAGEAVSGALLEAARVAQLYRGGRFSYVASPLYAGLLMLVLWGPITAGVLIAWFAAMVAIAAGRTVLHRRYLRASGSVAAAGRWEMLFAAGTLATGAVWSFAPAVLFGEASPPQQIAIVLVVGGSLIAAAGLYAGSWRAFAGYAALPFLATVYQLLQVPDNAYRLIALMLLLFAGILLGVYRDIRRGAERVLRFGLENEELAKRLADSEMRIRDAIESYPEGIAVFDAEDRLLVCNEAYASAYGAGRRASELPGVHYLEIAQTAFEVEVVPPEFAGQREQWLEERMARRHGGASRRLYQMRDGRWLQGRFERSRSGGSVSVFSDVTALKRAQEQYLAVLAEESLVLETLPVGVAFMENRVIARCNRRLEQMFGYAPGELTGRPARVLYASDAAWEAAGAKYAALRDRPVVEDSVEMVRKDGSRSWYSLHTRAVSADAPQESAIVAFSDISERHEAELALRRSEAMYRNLVETSNDLIWSMDREGRWSYLSPAAAQRIFGGAPSELIGRRFDELLAAETRERDVALFQRLLQGVPLFSHETRVLRGDGSQIDLSFNAVALRDAAGAIVGSTGTARDISAERAAAAALHESVEKLRLAVEAADLYYWEWDVASGQLHFGHSPAPALGVPSGSRMRWQDYLEQVHSEDRERFSAAARAAFSEGEPFAVEYRVEREGGPLHWFTARGKVLLDRQGRPQRMIGVSQDVTERKRQEEEARFLAHHDTLTGLPNRRLLDDRLKQALYLAQRRDRRVAVMLIDLDEFKQVNDTLGHRAGDAVLREVGRRLTACVRKADTLARHGGDEFVVVIPELALESDCQIIAEKILRALEPPFRVDGRDFAIGASIGISLYPGDAGDGETMLRNADVAMYRAKQLGKNNYLYYRG